MLKKSTALIGLLFSHVLIRLVVLLRLSARFLKIDFDKRCKKTGKERKTNGTCIGH